MYEDFRTSHQDGSAFSLTQIGFCGSKYFFQGVRPLCLSHLYGCTCFYQLTSKEHGCESTRYAVPDFLVDRREIYFPGYLFLLVELYEHEAH